MTKKKATLTVTRGLPGSGKSTWAKGQEGSVRVNRDELRRMLHGSRLGTGTAEKQVGLAQRAAVEALLRNGTDVIVDDTNLRSRVVREFAELAANSGAEFAVVDFTDVDVEECIRRDALRTGEDQVGEDVIRGMYQRYLAGKQLPLAIPAGLAEANPDAPYKPLDGGTEAVLVDIDGTVAVMGARSPYDWHRVGIDTPNAPVIAAVRAMHAAGHQVIYCSGRDEACRAETEAWLAEHVGVPYVALHMRPAGDQRKDSIVKKEIFNRELRHQYKIICVFDDRAQVVRMWRSLGLTVMQVAEGDF
ncbi:AAA family ATPase [Longispora albida]|uniref:phosphatase domain-containing protein n=1 Tax=Longispora albida TaxID=203523 RepID=UPI00037C2305|nr:AAA family ATPase [Longispora albida]